MPWRKKASSPAGVTLTIGEAAAVWADAPSWIIGSIPGLNAGSEYVNLTDFCALGPPPTLVAPWDAGSIRFPASLLEYAEAKLKEKLFVHYCEAYGDPVCSLVATISKNEGGGGNKELIGWTPLLPGTQVIRLEVVASNTGHVGGSMYSASDSGYLGQLSDFNPNVGQHNDIAQTYTAATRFSINYDNNQAQNFTVNIYNCAGSTYTPPAVATPPEGFIGPVAGLYPDLDAIGRALDALMQAAMQNAARLGILDRLMDPDAPVGVGSTEDADPDVPSHKPAGAIGLIVTVSNMSPEVDEVFGAPPVLHRLGYLVVGDGTAWHEPMELTANPFLLMPLPPGCESVSVILRTPAHATITWLRPAAGPIA